MITLGMACSSSYHENRCKNAGFILGSSHPKSSIKFHRWDIGQRKRHKQTPYSLGRPADLLPVATSSCLTLPLTAVTLAHCTLQALHEHNRGRDFRLAAFLKVDGQPTSRHRCVHQETLQHIDFMLILLNVYPGVALLPEGILLKGLPHSPCCFLHTRSRRQHHLHTPC